MSDVSESIELATLDKEMAEEKVFVISLKYNSPSPASFPNAYEGVLTRG